MMTEAKQWAVAILGVLVAWLAGFMACRATAAPAQAQAPAAVPYGYWLASCDSWPVSALQQVDTLSVERTGGRTGRRWAVLRVGSRRYPVVAHRLGEYSGQVVWSFRGPRALGVWMASRCTVRAYRDLMGAPAALRQWIAARSTCYGILDVTPPGGQTRRFRSWPCSWPTDPQRNHAHNLVRLDGIGPGVLAGGSGADAAGVENE